MADSVFTKIIKGEIPANKIYEDEFTYAFLDHIPKTPGHVLVVSRNQVAYVWDLPEEDYLALMKTVKRVAQRIKDVLEPKFVGEQIEGAAVAHAHVHVFPFNNVAEFHNDPDPDQKPDAKELSDMAARLAF